MSEPEIQDTRLHEQRLAAIWAHAYADQSLPAVLDALKDHDILVLIEKHDIWNVQIGKNEIYQAYGSLWSAAEIAPWLVKTAEDYYPSLRQSRLMMSRAMARVPPEFDEAQVG